MRGVASAASGPRLIQVERQHEEERAGTADPDAHAEERVDLRAELEEDAGGDDD